MFFSSTLSSPLLTGIPAETDIPAPVIATTRLLDWKALARRVKWGWALASLKSSKLIVCIQKSVIKGKKVKKKFPLTYWHLAKIKQNCSKIGPLFCC